MESWIVLHREQILEFAEKSGRAVGKVLAFFITITKKLLYLP
jgi:hypothetical protein